MDDTTTSGPRTATARGHARAAAHRRVVPSRTSRAQISSGGTQRTSADSWADPKPVAPREPLPRCVRPVRASTQVPIKEPPQFVPVQAALRRNLDGTFHGYPARSIHRDTGVSEVAVILSQATWPVRG